MSSWEISCVQKFIQYTMQCRHKVEFYLMGVTVACVHSCNSLHYSETFKGSHVNAGSI